MMPLGSVLRGVCVALMAAGIVVGMAATQDIFSQPTFSTSQLPMRFLMQVCRVSAVKQITGSAGLTLSGQAAWQAHAPGC